MRGTIALAAILGLVSLGGCITSNSEVPEWFEQRSAERDTAYPALRSVPRDTIANTDAAHWRQVERELVAVGDEVRANPRAEPTNGEQDPAAFVEEARRELEETRQSHEP
jgi:hypothetical protein